MKPPRLQPLDRSRLARARNLPITKIGPSQYRVGKHYVDLTEQDRCHCEDALLRGSPFCKHVLAAMIQEGMIDETQRGTP